MMNILRSAIIGLLIGLSSSYTIMTFTVLAIPNATLTGEELFKQWLIAAILGIVIGLISIIFNVERLNFALRLFIHISAITFVVFVAGYFGEWYDMSHVTTVVSLFLSIFIIYLISWIIFMLLLKKDLKKINHEIQKRRNNV